MSFSKRFRTGAASIAAGALALLVAACGGSSTPLVAPTITTQPADQAVVMGSTATFAVSAGGTAPLSYQWTRNGTAISGATGASYTTPATTLTDDGAKYVVTVSNGTAPNATSAQATLTVNPPPGTFELSSRAISAGEGVILTYEFPGTGTLQEGTGAAVPVTSGGQTVVYPTATTVYTFSWTNGGTTFPIRRTVAVKTYTPRHLYVVNGGSNTLSHFTVDVNSMDNPVSPRVGAGVATGTDPVHVVATPDEKFLYVANQGSASISAYALGATTGAATAVSGSPFAVPSDTAPTASAISASGKFLYVGCANSIQVFSVGATGALTAASSLKVTLTSRGSGDLLLHPSGKFLFVGDAGHAVVKTYAVDATSGALTFVSDAPVAGGPAGMAFDRAATHLVTRGGAIDPANNAALNVFSVNPYTGALASTRHFEGYGEIALWAPTALPFVRGTAGAHHGIAFGRQPGVDVVYVAYAGEVDQGTSMSGYWLDVATGAMPATNWEVGRGPVPYDPVTTWATPVMVDFWGSAGDSVFLDRSGKVQILTGASTGQFIVYPVTPEGSLGGSFIGDYRQDSGEPGDSAAHGVFTGTFQ
jgi:hypothetical protein